MAISDMSDLEAQALCFAGKAHSGQIRRYTREAYIVHPTRVVDLLKTHCVTPPTPEMLAAAYLHDTVEDTKVTLADILDTFGETVTSLVYELTDITKPGDGNRGQRKWLERKRLSVASKAAKTIKLTDIADNLPSVIEYDESFALTYVYEKLRDLEVLKEGDVNLYGKVKTIIDDYIPPKIFPREYHNTWVDPNC